METTNIPCQGVQNEVGFRLSMTKECENDCQTNFCIVASSSNVIVEIYVVFMPVLAHILLTVKNSEKMTVDGKTFHEKVTVSKVSKDIFF